MDTDQQPKSPDPTITYTEEPEELLPKEKSGRGWRIFFRVLAGANFLTIALPIIAFALSAKDNEGVAVASLLWLIFFGASFAFIVVLVNIIIIPYYLFTHKTNGAAKIAGILVIIFSIPVISFAGFWTYIGIVARNHTAQLEKEAKTAPKPDEISVSEATDLLKKCEVKEFYDRIDDYSPSAFQYLEPSPTGIYSISMGGTGPTKYMMYVSKEVSTELMPIAMASKDDCGEPVINSDYR